MDHPCDIGNKKNQKKNDENAHSANVPDSPCHLFELSLPDFPNRFHKLLHRVHGSILRKLPLRPKAGMRRFTRLTNGFSKNVENHADNVAFYFMHYNFCRVHQTLRVTRAMEAKLTDDVWEVEELVGLLEADEAKMIANGVMKRGPYQKKNATDA